MFQSDQKKSDVVVINKIYNFIKKKNHVAVKLFKKKHFNTKKKKKGTLL